MWKRILEALLAYLNRPKPGPVLVPPPVPPVPPVPTPVPPTPVPPVPPVPPIDTKCPQPYTLKLGFRQDARKLNPNGYRNMADITPMVKGACAHKGDPSPDAKCAVSEACGEVYNARYGEPQAWQTGPGFTRDPVERSSSNAFMLVFSTNSESEWVNGKYKPAGKYTVGVSYPFLGHWRCQDVTMDDQGRMHGGSNESSYDLPKEKA